MQDLSLHLLDIAENSIRAQATEIKMEVVEDISNDILRLVISDNGKGMNEQMLSQVTNPFITTRTLRRVGLGIPLLYQNCLSVGGSLKVESQEGKGTRIEAIMQYHHIDRLPLGDLPSSICVLIQANPKVDICYAHYYKEKTFLFETAKIKQMLEGVPIYSPEIVQWLKQYIKENLDNLHDE